MRDRRTELLETSPWPCRATGNACSCRSKSSELDPDPEAPAADDTHDRGPRTRNRRARPEPVEPGRRRVPDLIPFMRELDAFCLGMVLAAVLILVGTPAARSASEDGFAAGERHAAAVRAPSRLAYRPQRGMFLVAAPRLRDPTFAQTVVLILAYDETGALGLVVNRPTQLSLHDALVAPPPNSSDHAVYSGGPVEHRRLIALIRSPSAVDGSQHVFDDVYASGSMDTLRRMLESEGPAADFHAYLGYAGWSPGQLDAEIARGDWIVTPADSANVFDVPPGDVWRDLVRRNAGRWVHAVPAGPA